MTKAVGDDSLQVLSWTSLANSALLLAGCSRSGFDSSVTGSVTLDGKLLGLGGVVFVPLSGGGNPSVGTIGRDGHYTLRTANTSGLNAGKYRVCVNALDTPNPPPGVRDTTPPKQLVPRSTQVSRLGP